MLICSNCGWKGMPEETLMGECPKCDTRLVYDVRVLYWKDIQCLIKASHGLYPSTVEVAEDYCEVFRAHIPGTSVRDVLDYVYAILQDSDVCKEVCNNIQPHPHNSFTVGDIVVLGWDKYILGGSGWKSLGRASLVLEMKALDTGVVFAHSLMA